MKDFVLKQIVTLLLPFIQVFGVYVILHGHVSPGGAFAGGIVVGLGMIAFSTIYGLDRGRAKLPEAVTTITESYGTLWYVLMGLVGVFRGWPFLANKLAVSVGTPGALSSGGLIGLIGFGVGLRVASTMVTLFFALVEGDA